jgi:PAS domain S-box-containing protein
MQNDNYLKKELYNLIKTDESIFDFIQESSLDGLWYWDLENPEEEWMNPKFWSVLGYDYREMPHKASAWKDIIHPRDLELATEKFLKHFENPNHSFDQSVRYTHKNGTTVWIRCRGLAIRDQQGKPLRMLGTHQEITDLKNSELLLQNSTNLLSISQQISKIGSWELDLKTKEVLWSEQLYKMYGFDPEISTPPYTEHMKLFTPESWDRLSSAILLAEKQGVSYELELETIRLDGSRGWMWARGEAVVDKNKNIIGVRGVAQDITDRKSIALEKDALSKRLKYALDASGDGIWDWTPENGITVYSKAWVEMLGYEVGELASLASEWSNRLHPDDAPWVFEAIIKLTQTPNNGDIIRHEYRFRNKAGDYLWILNKAKVVERNEKGEATRVVGTHTDITREKKREAEIAAAHKDINDITNAVNKSAALSISNSNGIILKVNTLLCELSGYTEAELIGQHQSILNYDFHDNAFWKEMEDTIKSGKAWSGEIKKQTKDGKEYWVYAVIQPIKNEKGQVIEYISIRQDITKRKKAEKNQKIAIKQAKAASKAKSEFLANMSHEIRTPLNGVIGFTELLAKTQLNSVQKEYVKSANISGHTLLGIINDILDFSKIEAGMLELEYVKTDMVVLFENSIEIVKFAAADKELELLLDIDPAMPRFAHIDPIRTKQILANLLGNAIKFTKKGEVALTATYHLLDHKQGEISIAVRDTGIGISEEQKAKLFKSFSQADGSTTRQFGGTGLGLSISQMIAEKMGSKINIDSTPGFGSTFFFEFTTNFEQGENPEATKILDIKRCLIIDDNKSSQRILTKMLQKWQIASICCDNGFEALQKLDDTQPYDAIICDYNMPYINGIESIRMLKDKLKLDLETQPVILLHSSSQNETINQQCEELGIRYRLNKPIKSNDLFTNLSNLHQKQQVIHEIEKEPILKSNTLNNKVKILIAEDNRLNMFLSKTMISELFPNCKIIEAHNGIEAIEQYKNNSPEIIFMDMHMPEIDGIEATKKIRIIEKRTKNHSYIIALTANAMKQEKEKCLAAGMDYFLTKPMESQKIELVLNTYFQLGKKPDKEALGMHAKDEAHFGFNELINNLDGDQEVAAQVIAVFSSNLPDYLDQLQQAYNEMKTKDIEEISHLIKGSSLTMRCNILAEIAGKIERDAKDNFLENLEVLHFEIKEEWEAIKRLIQKK